jgi:hypothetical protein
VFQQIRAEQPRALQDEQANRAITDDDKRKILRLFNFDKWPLYVKWVDEKLEESGELLESFLEASGVESVSSQDPQLGGESEAVTTKKEGRFREEEWGEQESELELLEAENQKLSRQHAALASKYQHLRDKYQQIMK